MRNWIFISLLLLSSVVISSFRSSDDWGFFAHRRINQLAVFTLPTEMLPLFKAEIEYVTEHAVDPDKRRYASIYEGIRHYIDIDQWEQFPFDTIPRQWDKVLFQYASAFTLTEEGDTVICKRSSPIQWNKKWISWCGTDSMELQRGLTYFRKFILPKYYEADWSISSDSVLQYFGVTVPGRRLFWKDHFSEHGVLPYHLMKMQYRLTDAFTRKDVPLILRLSAEMGHYIGDAHVPLHTSKNYNGQLTDQVGIHAFWESRIPELFANEAYDFFVPEASYQANKEEFFWRMIEESHVLVDSVLEIEKRLRASFPEDQQMCFDERLGRTVLTQCRDFAKAYQDEMQGMVEERMRKSIWAIGSSWYTAWVDAGQPDFSSYLQTEIVENNLSLPPSNKAWNKRKHAD